MEYSCLRQARSSLCIHTCDGGSPRDGDGQSIQAPAFRLSTSAKLQTARSKNQKRDANLPCDVDGAIFVQAHDFRLSPGLSW